MRIKLSNVRKKVRELTNVTKTVTCDKNRADIMLVLLNMTMELSNLRKKKIKEPLYVTRIVKCDIGTAQCDNGTVKCEKK